MVETAHQKIVRTPPLTTLRRWVQLIVDSRYTVWILLALGVVRVLVFTLAYPPAHGADSADYFLYAAQFKGLDTPLVFSIIYPLYPIAIYLTYYVLGSIYWLIGIQFVMSAVQGVLFYIALRRLSPYLAFAVAVAVIGDAQTGILYSFTSTEPLYMFTLNLAFMLFVIQATRQPGRLHAGDVFLGVVLGAILLTRPVGRYLIVPFGILFLLGTRSPLRTTVLVAGYGATLVASMLFNQIVFDQLELTGGGTFMLNRPLLKSGLLDASNGPASAEVIELHAACPEGQRKNACLTEQLGDWPSVRKLYERAYQEMLETRGDEFAKLVFDDFTDFLRLPGRQYSGAITPSDVQCADIASVADTNTNSYIDQDVLMIQASGVTYDTLYPIVYDLSNAMCPPWPDNDRVRTWVDALAERYRSFSRPHPYLWYGLLGILTLALPRARRFLLPVLLAGGILANHALASAVVLNVQPRYIAVTNPFRIVLLLTLLYIIAETGWYWLCARFLHLNISR